VDLARSSVTKNLSCTCQYEFETVAVLIEQSPFPFFQAKSHHLTLKHKSKLQMPRLLLQLIQLHGLLSFLSDLEQSSPEKYIKARRLFQAINHTTMPRQDEQNSTLKRTDVVTYLKLISFVQKKRPKCSPADHNRYNCG